MYNGFDWYGRTLEVREVRRHWHSPYRHSLMEQLQDRYAGLSGPGAFRGGFRGGLRGLRGGRGGFRGGFRGGYAGAAPGRDFSSQDLYADYSGPDSQSGGLRMEGYPAGGFAAGAPYPGFEAEPSQQIMVRNVRIGAFISDVGFELRMDGVAAVVYC